MKSNLINRKQKFLRTIYGGLSLTTALFIFQCCYGSPHDMYDDVWIEGKVKSILTKNPIPGIRVSVVNQNRYAVTDSSGAFTILAYEDSTYRLRFEDIDSTQNGMFLAKDTVLPTPSRSININLDVK